MSITVLSEYRNTVAQIAASDVLWSRLQGLLSADAELQQQYHFILNQNGELIDRTPYQAAVTIRNTTNGRQNVWIDWCGWPMFYNVATLPWRYRFYEFVKNIDPAALPVQQDESFIDFDVVGYKREQAGWYPYRRGLHVWFDLAQSPWADPGPPRHWGWWINREAPASISDDGRFIYSSFAIRYWDGFYFYAYANETEGVDADTFFRFIQSTLTKYAAMKPTPTQPSTGTTPGAGGGEGGAAPPGETGGRTSPGRTVSLQPMSSDSLILFAGVAGLLIGAGVLLIGGEEREGV